MTPRSVLPLILVTTLSAQDVMIGFRHDGTGIFPPDCRPPAEFDGIAGRNLAWKVPLPNYGNSSPIAVGTRVFVTCAAGWPEGQDCALLLCLDGETGKELWRRDLDEFAAMPAGQAEEAKAVRREYHRRILAGNRLMRELEASEQRYRTFMQLANEGIWCYEAAEPIPIDLPEEEQIELMFTRGYLAECNPAYARMYGYDNPEELVGKKLGERVISDNPQNREMLRFFIRNGYRMELVESVDRDHEGKERYILNSVVGVVENGSLVRAWGVQIDITELRRLQKELEQAYRVESIGRLAGGVAHDFNNVLTAILGYTEMALERATDETLRRYLEGVQKAAQRAAGLTRQLLAYARKQVSQPQLVSLPEWLDDARTLLARLIPESVRLELEIQPNIGSMTADPDQLTQILLNLAVNARDAMPAGGVLTIRVYSPPKTPDHVVLEVSDTGMGIPQEILPYIFEPFFTTKPVGQGTGMGLAAVRGIVDQMGGRIEVDTAVGKGTTFRVFLPREFRKPEGG